MNKSLIETTVERTIKKIANKYGVDRKDLLNAYLNLEISKGKSEQEKNIEREFVKQNIII